VLKFDAKVGTSYTKPFYIWQKMISHLTKRDMLPDL